MDDSPKMGPIDNFIRQAEGFMQRELPSGHLQAVLAEAKGHLTERSAELAKIRMFPADAERKAVAAFGDSSEWSKSIISSFYADSHTTRASQFAFFCGGVILFTSVVQSAFNNFSYDFIINPLLIILLIGVFAGSFRSRQSRAPRFDKLMPIAAAFMFFIGATQWVTLHGVALPRVIVRSELAAAESNGPDAAAWSDPEYPYQSILGTTVPSDSSWKSAPLWLVAWYGKRVTNRLPVASLMQAVNREPGFSLRAGFFAARTPIVLAILISLVDWMGTSLGRFTFRRFWRKSQSA